ncbi:MAG: ATP-binding cassette domain-containing protein, partial [Eisenbergiella massiliensis]
MGQFIIEASNIRKKYDDKTVLKDISLQAQRGEAVGLVGVNGCGKSTLLRILAGLSNPSSGEVSLQAGTRMAFIPDRYEKINMTLGK